jgi:alpha-beta hydrolase superfamily lysophospholipase
MLAGSAAYADLPRLGRLGAAFAAEDGKLVLRQVAANSNAARAGLQDGDVVIAINGQTSTPTGAFVRPYLRHGGGAKIPFVIQRKGDEAKEVLVEYRPAAIEKPEGMLVEYGSVAVGSSERRTLTTVPKDKKRHSAILFLAGSGCVSQESPEGTDPVVQILYEFTRRGFVTIRTEKTSMGDSTGPPCYSDAGDMNQEIEGYRAAYAALLAHPAVDPASIYILGHSAGSTLAPLVARDLKIAGIVAMGAMGTDFLQYILDMRRRTRELEGRPAAEVAKQMEVIKGCLTKLLVNHEPADAIEKWNEMCKRQVRFDSPQKYIDQWMQIDLAKAWAATPAPAIVVYGTGDFVTSEAESQALVNKINSAGNPKKAKLVVLPMDHGFLAHADPARAFKAEQGVIPPAGILMGFVDAVQAFVAETQSR